MARGQRLRFDLRRRLHGRVAHLVPHGESRAVPRGGRGDPGQGEAHLRHRHLFDRRDPRADPSRRGRRCGRDRRGDAVLQQAAAAGAHRPLRAHRRRDRAPDHRLQHPEPHRHPDRARDDAPDRGEAQHRRGEGLDGGFQGDLEPGLRGPEGFEIYSGDDWATFGYVCLGAVGRRRASPRISSAPRSGR